MHQRAVGEIRLQRRTCERGGTHEDDARGGRSDDQPLARRPVRHEDRFFLWLPARIRSAFRALVGPALHRRSVQARSPSSRRGWPCRREYAPPVWARPAPPLPRPRLRVRKQRQAQTLSCADETGSTVDAVSRVRLRRLRRPSAARAVRPLLSSRRSRYRRRASLVERKLLAQRHPMAATGGLGVGRLFGVRRRFSVGGQIT